MTLTDTGPLVAVLDRADPAHSRCRRMLPELSRPLVTTLPVLTEGFHLLGRQFGWRGQQPLWQMISAGELVVLSVSKQELDRAAVLMETYADSPMDFADASLVVAAEQQKLRRIFTLDGHFRAYRLTAGHVLQVIPDEP